MMRNYLSTSSILFLLTIVLASACSSSSSSAGNPVYCALTIGEITGQACSCAEPDATYPANSTACSEASIGTDSVCSLHTGKSCQCDPFLCLKSAATDPLITCSYGLAKSAFFSASAIVQPSACVGAHYCMRSTSFECACQTDACSDTDTEVTSCTDASARAQLATDFQTFNSGKAVDDCRSALASGSSGSGGTVANVCPGGPGKCTDGDSSTCNCGTACIQTATCAGCSYECVKGCATDDDCAGFYSGDTPPVALKCLGASSTNPTPHCGL